MVEGQGWSKAPTTGSGQDCGFCGAGNVEWVHLLDEDKIWYQAWGETYSIPHFWIFCDVCEKVYQTGDIDAMRPLITDESSWGEIDDLDEGFVKPIRTLLAADLGRRRLL
jgi:hypothetical protein